MINNLYSIKFENGISIVEVDRGKIKYFIEAVFFTSHKKRMLLYKKVINDKVVEIKCEESEETVKNMLQEYIKALPLINVFGFKSEKTFLKDISVFENAEFKYVKNFLDKMAISFDDNNHILYNEYICILMDGNEIINFIINTDDTEFLQIEDIL